MSLALVLTTVGNHEDAIRISRGLVEERLCACAQIQVIESVYRWNGTVVEEPEFRLLLKTTTNGCEALEARLVELHPYELPAVVRINVDSPAAAFADWVRAEVLPAHGDQPVDS
jgi:periplasmic divalent cation tolerance protein